MKKSFTNDDAKYLNVMFVFQLSGGWDNAINPGTTICLDNISLTQPSQKPARSQHYYTVLRSLN